MAWFLPAALTGIGLLRGHQQAQREQAIEDQTRKQRAAEIRYSPWTGMRDFTQVRPAGSQFGTILGGGVEGLGGGALLGKALGASSAPAEAPLQIDSSMARMQDPAMMQNPSLYNPQGYNESLWSRINKRGGSLLMNS